MLLEDMYQKPPFYRYATLLPRLENSFGVSHIHVYDFADAKEDESGLTNRLLREIGHDIQLPDSELERTNSSMSQEATLLLDSLNRQYPHIVSGRHNDKRKTSALTWCQNMPGRKYRAPEYVYKELDGQARRHIEWVTNNYRVNLRSRDRGDEQPEILNIKQIDKRIRRLHRLFSMPGILQRIAFRLLDGQNHSRAS